MGKIIDHKKQFDYLKNAFENGKLHHSYIFYGPKGSGKFDFALDFSKYVQCEDKKDGYCEKCKNCKVNRDGFIIDSYIINLGKEKNIKIEEVGKIKNLIDHSSVSGNYKIIIINDAQNMTRDAREVLLKTLEEPPEKSLLILVTDQLNALPKTIISRCPAIFFPRLKSDPEKERVDIDKRDLFEALRILNLDNRRFIEEIHNSEKEELENKYHLLANNLETLLGESIFSKMILAKEMSDDEEVTNKIEIWISMLYNILVFKGGSMDWDGKTMDFLGRLEKKLEYDRIVEALEKMLNLLNLLDTNASKRVLFEDFVLNM